MSYATHVDTPVFGTPVRWTLRVLAWLAFGVSAYLALHAVTQTSVAGCGVSSQNGCDIVLSSIWAKWLGMPVAVAGLACYAALAALSVLLGLRNSPASRWINTVFVMLAIIAAGASLWFIAIQIFAIGEFCPYCLVTDLCGIAIGALALWSTARWLSATRYVRSAHTAAPGLMALRCALPTAARSAPVTRPVTPPQPSLAIALGGAGAVLAMLIGGQILLPAKNFEVQQVALNDSIEMVGTGHDASDAAPSLDAEIRVAMRVPAEIADNREGEATAEPNNSRDGDANNSREGEPNNNREGEASAEPQNNEQSSAVDNGSAGASPSQPTAVDDSPIRERIVKLLGGNLSLDIYKHPLIGSPDAPHVMVEMVSYDCLHCRKLHRTMKQALARYGDQVAIIVMVVPLEMGCNKLVTDPAASHRGACSTARMALGVATLNPKAFPRFHDWLMADKEKPPALDKIVSKAYGLVDRARLRELSGGDELKKQIGQYVDLFARLRNRHKGKKSFGLPVQILGDHVMSGSVEKASDFYKAWEEHLGVKPR